MRKTHAEAKDLADTLLCQTKTHAEVIDVEVVVASQTDVEAKDHADTFSEATITNSDERKEG